MVTPGSDTTHLPDRYELLEPLGRGGMGVVWLANDAVLQRQVAIKEVVSLPGVDAAEAEAMRARVMREARAAARLNHPNVTTVYDVLRDDERTWIVMEYVEAPTLAEVVSERGPLSPQEAADLGIALLDALEAAHAKGIVHRDVKPGNVMVPATGGVKLADFGVAAIQGDPKITATGLIVGSPSFMSPEQAREGTSTEATDIWGLGATLYFAVEGTPPFDRGAPIPTLTAVTHEPPRPAARAGDLAVLLERMLDKDPAARPAAADVRRALDRVTAPAAAATAIVAEEPAAYADEEPVHGDVMDNRRRSAWPAVLGGIALLALALLLLPRLTGTADPPADQAAPPAGEEPDAGDDAAQPQPDAQDEADEEADEEAEPSTSVEETAAPPQTPAAEPTTAAAGVPGEWVPMEIGDTGSTVAHPPEWSVMQRDEATADIQDPSGGRYLRVQYTDSPRDDAVEDWRRQSEAFGDTHDAYREISIEPYDYPGAETAALWEYAYTEGGARLHAYNLAIVIGGRGYALNFQTRQKQWDESQELWQQFVAGFDPAA